MKQKTINKLFVMAIILLTAIVLILRFTEHDRVTFYNCYDWATSDNINSTHDHAVKICQERID